MKADMHGLIPRCPHSRDYEGQVETVPTSGNSSDPVCFRKRGMPFFPGIVTVSVTIYHITARNYMAKNKIRPELRAFFMPDRSGQVSIADGIMDRLLGNAHRIELKGESLRRKKLDKIV